MTKSNIGGILRKTTKKGDGMGKRIMPPEDERDDDYIAREDEEGYPTKRYPLFEDEEEE